MTEIALNKLLLRYRIANKMTQDDMAKYLDCTQAQYSIWESGSKNPSYLRDKSIRELIKE